MISSNIIPVIVGQSYPHFGGGGQEKVLFSPLFADLTYSVGRLGERRDSEKCIEIQNVKDLGLL